MREVRLEAEGALALHPVVSEWRRRGQERSLRRGAEVRTLFGTVVVVRQPGLFPPGAVSSASAPSGAPDTFTLRFDFGRVTFLSGRVGRPELTLSGTEEALLGLPGSVRKLLSRELWGRFGRAESRERLELQLFGAFAHPRLLEGCCVLFGL